MLTEGRGTWLSQTELNRTLSTLSYITNEAIEITISFASYPPVRSRVGSCLTSWRRGAGWDRSWCTPARAPWSGFGPIFNTLACHLGLFLLSVFSICSDLPGRLSSEDGSPMLIRSRLLCGAEPSVLEPSTLTIAWISFKRLNGKRFANARLYWQVTMFCVCGAERSVLAASTLTIVSVTHTDTLCHWLPHSDTW